MYSLWDGVPPGTTEDVASSDLRTAEVRVTLPSRTHTKSLRRRQRGGVTEGRLRLGGVTTVVEVPWVGHDKVVSSFFCSQREDLKGRFGPP